MAPKFKHQCRFSGYHEVPDIRTRTGTLRNVFEALLLAYKQKILLSADDLREANGGSEATKRARQIREGFNTAFLKPHGKMLWVKCEENLYSIETIFWETWLRRDYEAKEKEYYAKLRREIGRQQNLFDRAA